MPPIPPSELILTNEGRIYHLNLLPEELAEHVILVGDPERVPLVSRFFDRIELQVTHREFRTHTGYINNKRVSVVSTGIGTDSIDITLTELDALMNIDFASRLPRSTHRTLSLVRLGTCGGLHPDIPPGSFVRSTHALGLDNLLYYYEHTDELPDKSLQAHLLEHLQWDIPSVMPYLVSGSESLGAQLSSVADTAGITLTAPGFYGPQGRSLRARTRFSPKLWQHIANYASPQGLKICNFEMEISALYVLAQLLHHKASAICMVIANRHHHTFNKSLPSMDTLIEKTLKQLLCL